MRISELRQFIERLSPAIAVIGLSKTAENSISARLEDLATSLAPFDHLDAQELSELLKVTTAYMQSGEIPDWVVRPKSSSKRTTSSRAPKPPKLTIEEAISSLETLKEAAIGTEPSEIRAKIEALEALTANDLKSVQQKFMGAAIGKSKSDRIKALYQHIDNYRSNMERLRDSVYH
jgi:hypothetical protein